MIVSECYDCKSVETIGFGMEGKKCSKCNGRLIPLELRGSVIMGEDIKVLNIKVVNLSEKEVIYMPLERKNLNQIYETKVHFNLPKIEIKLCRKEIKKIKRILGMDKKYLKYIKRVSNRRKLHGK